MNLITDEWIPVIRQDKSPDCIAPWQIAEQNNPVIEITAPRPDFQGALYQLLIGLLQTCFAPEDEDEWLDKWEEMPEPEEVKSAFERVSSAFELDNPEGPAFMQDFEGFEGEWLPIEDLIGGALSVNTRKGNKDLFVKSKQTESISPYWAALALFNLQSTGVLAWGKHRVGLRGNAPLTTLVIPDSEQSKLWDKLWLNIIQKEDMDLVPGDHEKEGIADIFPWMGKTRTSPNKEPTSPLDTSPLQHYWPMPRRIRLKIEDSSCLCDLSGKPTERCVRFYKRISNGVYYTNGWVHPLTPYGRAAKNKFPKPFEGKYAGEGFRQWVALNYDEYTDDDDKKMRWGCALAVKHYYEEMPNLNLKAKLWCFGYDATNANVKCWYESIMPTFNLEADEVAALKSHVSEVLQIAYQIVDELRYSLIQAWFKPQIDSNGKQTWKHIVSGKKEDQKTGRKIYHALKTDHLSAYHMIDYEYWEYLEKIFSETLVDLIDFGNAVGKPLAIYSSWLKEIQKYCLSYFDNNAWSETDGETSMKRIVEAKRYFLSTLYPKKSGLLKDINGFREQMEATA